MLACSWHSPDAGETKETLLFTATERFGAEPPAEADRGRHPDFPSFNVLAGGPNLSRAFGGKGCVLGVRDDPMEPLPQELLSAALHVKWEHGHSEDKRAAELIAKRVSGFSAEQYDEASRLAAAMDWEAGDLAVAWFDQGGQGPELSMAGLKDRHPGFSWEDYGEAVNNNILWARK